MKEERKYRREKLLNKIIACLVMAGVAVATVRLAGAEQAGKVPRIGILLPWTPTSGVSLSFLKAFRQGLRELGYVNDRSLATELRYTGGMERFPDLAAELVRLKVDVIVTTSGPQSHAAKQATNTIPIVFTQVIDPVAEGLVASLARPGGNLTGLSQIGPELAGKRLELLKEAFPKISRVAVLGTMRSQGHKLRLKETQIAATAIGVELQSLEVHRLDDFEAAFRAATTGRAAALIVLQSALVNTNRKKIVELAVKNRLPTMFTERTHVEAGGLMSYGPSYFELQRRAAGYVDKILKGTKPADIPVEQPKKFELAINLKTAEQIGLMIPPNVLARADRVIR